MKKQTSYLFTTTPPQQTVGIARRITPYHRFRCRLPCEKIRQKSTGKELDRETGLYYFGARYLDPRTSRWLSPDPAIWQGDFLPSAPNSDAARRRNANLPNGGVFNTINLHVFNYSNNNPIRFVDPDGRTPFEFGEVVTPADGTIYRIRYWDGINSYGNFIIIQHDDGRFSLLGHLEGALPGVQEGQRVKQGDPIATGGSSGRGDDVPPHLHWSVFEGVDAFHSSTGDTGIFLGPGFVVNFARVVDPQILVDSGAFIHPSQGEITDSFGSTWLSTRPFHEGIDYSLVRRRQD